MSLVRVCYISAVMQEQLDSLGGMNALVQHAQRRNKILGVTGALIFTGSHFAHALEGSHDVVNDLLIRIRRDPRHSLLVHFGNKFIDVRLFRNWVLAYTGPSVYISRIVTQVLAKASTEPLLALEKLLDLMTEFTSD